MAVKALKVGNEASNGKVKASTSKAVSGNGDNNIKTVAKETQKEEIKVKPKPTLVSPKFSLQERIERVKLLDGLANKRVRVVDTLSDLRKFQFSSDESCSLSLEDSSGKEFNTSNSNLIGMLTEHLENLLQDKVKELDAQILEFEI